MGLLSDRSVTWPVTHEPTEVFLVAHQSTDLNRHTVPDESFTPPPRGRKTTLSVLKASWAVRASQLSSSSTQSRRKSRRHVPIASKRWMVPSAPASFIGHVLACWPQ